MIRLFKHYVPYAVLILGLVDFLLLLGAAEAGWSLRLWQLGGHVDPDVNRLPNLLAFAVTLQVAMVGVGVYSVAALQSVRFATARLVVAIALGILALSLLFFLLPPVSFWRSSLFYAMWFALVALFLIRALLRNVLGGEGLKRRVMVLGAGPRAARIEALAAARGANFAVVGFVGMNDGASAVAASLNRDDIRSLPDHLLALNAGEVVLALEERRNALPLNDLLRIKTTGVSIHDFSSFLERETGRVDLDSLNPSWLIFSDGFSAGRRLSSAAKRVFDIVVSTLLLVTFGPVILVTALLVKLESKGPAFYRQRRVGLYGQLFDVIKLRSMRQDAEVGGKAVWAQKDDPRVTRIGRFIRKTRLDELPQAWSVLKGQMSFVGPRPERPQFVADLEARLPYYAERHVVKPGITGWAQINYPYGASVEDAREKLEFDLYYAKNYSPFLDVLILLQTARVVLWPEKAGGAMTGFLILWSHVVAAALYGALAVFQLRRWNGDPRNRPLLAAFAAMSVWTIFLALVGQYNLMAQLAESGRNLAFLAFMYGLMTSPGDDRGSQRALKGVFAAVAAVIGLQIVVGGVMPQFEHAPIVLRALASTSQIIGLTIAAGALILVHNIYGLAAPDSRSALRFPMAALAVMWAIDLHLYTVDYFLRTPAHELFAARGVLLAGIVPLFALGLRNVSWRIQVSRVATFQSLSVIAILAYIIAMMLAARAIEIVGGDWARIGQVAIVLGMTLAALLLLPSAKLRAWLRVILAKHLFEHRYDYRQEWLRFTDTVGKGGEGAPLEERVVKALADIGGAPGGLLLLVEEDRRLSAAGHWNWSGVAPLGGADGAEALLARAEQGYVVDFAAIQDGRLAVGKELVRVPAWLAAMDRAWAGVPLSHEGRLAGLVILEHPAIRRRLDWEDFDLFRTAGIQAASYIAEARGQQALADARRFDEFNRRFAFIMHDIKNLVSQLSLVTRNAERHADNPEFRADMIATLQSSVRKMNDLLARLSPGAARESDPPRAMAVQPLLDAIAAAKARQHPVRAVAEAGLFAMADPAGLEQALAHLVQNAIDASDPDEPVVLRAFESGGDVAIEVIDRGAGMTAEFVRTRLFQPFASTKELGFGVGAFEAKSLINAMGGRLEVESRPGDGTRFTLFLPGAESRAPFAIERKRA